MAKYGKLDLSDDSDDDTIKSSSNTGINGALSVRRSAKYSVALSDEENDSSDLDSAPTTPVPKHLPRIKKAYSSKNKRIRETSHLDGGSFRDVQEAEETGLNVSARAATPIRTLVPPLTPSHLFASPSKIDYTPSSNPLQDSPSKQLLSIPAIRRLDRATTGSMHDQDLASVLAAASFPNAHSRPFLSPNTSTQQRTQPSGPSGSLLVRLKRPATTATHVDGHPSKAPINNGDPFRLPNVGSGRDLPLSFPAAHNSISPELSPISSPTNAATDSEIQLSQEVYYDWVDHAQRRADLANAHYVPGSKDGAIVLSDSESEAMASYKELQAMDVVDPELGMPMPVDAGNTDDANQLSEKITSVIGTEGRLSMAFSVRRYVDMFLESVPKIWGAPSTTAQNTQEGNHAPSEGTSQLTVELAPKIQSAASEPNESIQEVSQAEAPKSPAGEPSIAPINTVLFTPNTELSTAPTLVSDKQVALFSKPPPPALVEESPIAIAGLESHLHSASDGSYTAGDFAHGNSLMRIDAVGSIEKTDDPFFAILQAGALDSEPLFLPEYDSESEPTLLPPLSYPTWRFTGVTVPRIGKRRSEFPLWPTAVREEPSESPSEHEDLEINWDDISDSELSGPALDSYLAIRYYQEYIEEPSRSPRKRKAEVLTESSFDEDSEEEYRHAAKSVTRQPGKRRKLAKSGSNNSRASSSPIPTNPAPPRQISAAGSRIDTPYGLCVDDIDTSLIEVKPARDSLVTTTQICHQCRNSSTTNMTRVQCGNVASFADGRVSHRCNKTFCERCLRAWYGFDDVGMSFLKRKDGQQDGSMGSGVGLGIVDGIWMCPVCISFCMCTICSRRRGVPRTRYRPSSTAVFSTPWVKRRIKGKVTRDPPDLPPSATSSNSITKIVRFTSSRIVPPTPVGWMPLIPTPTPGLDSVYYEATRPCTRDFPTGAPQPTAANHAPTLFQTGAILENDGLEDLFTGSEADESDTDGEDVPSAQDGVVIPTPRENFMIVTPGRKLPSTTKKAHPLASHPHSPHPIHSPAPLPTVQPDNQPNPHASVDDDAATSHRQANHETGSTTVDPMDIFGRARVQERLNDATFADGSLLAASVPFPLPETNHNAPLDNASETSPHGHDNLPDSMFLPDSAGPIFDLGIRPNHRDSELNETPMETVGHFEDMQHLLESVDTPREHDAWFPIDADGDHLMGKRDSSVIGDPDQPQESYMGASQEFQEYLSGALDVTSSNPYESHTNLLPQSTSDDPMVGTPQALDINSLLEAWAQ